MTIQRTFDITGITCAGCYQTVQEVLSELGLRVVKLHKDPPRVTLEMPSRTPVQELNQALAAAGQYKLADHQLETPVLEGQEATSYRPLVLILMFLLLAVALEQWQLDSWNISLAARHFMAGFFLVFSFFKLLDLAGFARVYQGYDLLAAKFPWYARVYPFIELGLGIYFLSPLNFEGVLWFTLALMTVSTLGVVRSLYQRKQIRCACLGTVFNLPMSTVTLVEDLLMIVMAGAMLLWA